MIQTGVGFVQPLFFIGVVENRNDPRLEGRVQVRAFGVHGTNEQISTEDLPWATLIIGNHDVNFTPPPLNAWVFGFFIDGRDAQQPMILGLIPTQSFAPVNPEETGWGAVPLEDYDRQAQGSRPRDIGLSPMSGGRLATGEFLDETYIAAQMTNRVCNIPIAGGTSRTYNPVGNSNSWTNEAIGETSGGSAVANPVSGNMQERINALDNDPEFQSALQDIIRENGVTREEVYAVIRGESAFNPSITHSSAGSSAVQSGRGYGGLFQMGAGTGPIGGRTYTALEVSRMTPGAQARLYREHLRSIRSRSGLGSLSGRLPMVQAAPSRIAYDNSREVYAVGSREYNANPGWRGPDGRITVQSIADYYYQRNAVGPADPSTLAGSGASPEPSSTEPTSTINPIRERIREIDEQIQILQSGAGGDAVNAEIQSLLTERAALEEQLRGQSPSEQSSTYTGYMDVPETERTTWCEPESPYGTQYPYNRVTETAAGHVIEIDDTPGAERIMIWHNSGSYIQLSNSSVTHKTVSDSYNIHDTNHHVYIGGANIVTIEGDSHVLVKGNKIEEIQGNYTQIVHGNISMGAARRLEIQGADRADIRSASLSLDSNVENMQIRTSKNITFESGESINLNSRSVRIGASENLSLSSSTGLFLQSEGGIHMRAQGNMHINPNQNLYLRANGGTVSVQAEGSVRVNSNAFISMNANSTMDLNARSNMILSSESTLNMNSSGILGIKSNADLYIEGTNVHVKASDTLFAAGTNETHINSSQVYIDDVVFLSSGNASSPNSKQEIEAAPYGDDFGGFDIAPEADEAPQSETPTPASSEGSDGAAEPPTPSISNTELTPTEETQETSGETPSETSSEPTPSEPMGNELSSEIVQDGHMKTVIRSDNGTVLYADTIPGQTGHRPVHGSDYVDYASGVRPVWEGSLPSGISLGENTVNGYQFNVREYRDNNGTRFYSTTDFVRYSNDGTYARITGSGILVDHRPTSSVGGPLNTMIPGAVLPTRPQAVSITGVARTRGVGVLRPFVAIGGNATAIPVNRSSVYTGTNSIPRGMRDAVEIDARLRRQSSSLSR